MVRLREGDDLALNELMERWQKPLHSFILRYVGNHRDSIELAEETFVRVYQHRSRFNFQSKFSTWLLTIATNLFGTTYYSLVGLHAFHVIVGLLGLGLVMALALASKVNDEHAGRVGVLGLYWHFVDAVWVVVFTVVYVIGR